MIYVIYRLAQPVVNSTPVSYLQYWLYVVLVEDVLPLLSGIPGCQRGEC